MRLVAGHGGGKLKDRKMYQSYASRGESGRQPYFNCGTEQL